MPRTGYGVYEPGGHFGGRVEFNPGDGTITVYEKRDRFPSLAATYTIMEFMALLAGHILSPYESLTNYYGLYSSSHRGKEKRENGDALNIEVKEEKRLGKASSTWSRLIHRIFEACPVLDTGSMRSRPSLSCKEL